MNDDFEILFSLNLRFYFFGDIVFKDKMLIESQDEILETSFSFTTIGKIVFDFHGDHGIVAYRHHIRGLVSNSIMNHPLVLIQVCLHESLNPLFYMRQIGLPEVVF